jgi:hypothetical protein
MSRGPGRIERAIMAVVAAEPDNAFTVADLCDRVYPGVNRIEKKHRVAVARAMKNAADRSAGELGLWTDGGCARGNSKLVLFRRYDVMSLSLARLKADGWEHYRCNHPHRSRVRSEADLRAMLAPGGRYHHHVAIDADLTETGAWHRHVLYNIAQRDGDEETIAVCERIQAVFRRQLAALASRVGR